MRSPALVRSVFGLLAALCAVPATLPAQPWDDGGVPQTVARISYISGNASFSRGDEPEDWMPAAPNVPMTLGDRIYTNRRSHVELELDGAAVYLAPDTDFAALNMTRDVQQFSLPSGTAALRVRYLDPQQALEIDTPNAAVTIDQPGDYRIDVDEEGSTRVAVERGLAYVASGGGEVPVRRGSEIEIWGVDGPTYDFYPLQQPDRFDEWVDARFARYRSPSARYVSDRVVGYQDLDRYGRWDSVPGYGYCWTPASVSADWRPYYYGRWNWQDPWGWTWISDEPWGWAPYHYGRWTVVGARWYWVPVGPQVRAVAYSPALVAFVGGAGLSFSLGGFSVSMGHTGTIGWFPLGPSDPAVPWWGSARRVDVANVTFSNRAYVTVVNQTSFVTAAPVQRSVVADATVLRQVRTAPVLAGPVPILPSRQSLRGTAVSAPASRPSQAVLSRPVVSRIAPPAAPPRFDEKVSLIRENRGAPVAPQVAARLSVDRAGARAVQPIRPVAVQRGNVFLTPRSRNGDVPAPQPVRAAPRGKALATEQRPIVAAPSDAASEREAAAPRVAPGAVAPPPAAQPRPENRPADTREEARPVPPGLERRPPPRREVPPPPGQEARRPETPVERRPPELGREAAQPPLRPADEPAQRPLPPGQERRLEVQQPPAAPPAEAAPQNAPREAAPEADRPSVERRRRFDRPRLEAPPPEEERAAPPAPRSGEVSAPPQSENPRVEERKPEPRGRAKGQQKPPKKDKDEDKQDQH